VGSWVGPCVAPLFSCLCRRLALSIGLKRAQSEFRVRGQWSRAEWSAGLDTARRANGGCLSGQVELRQRGQGIAGNHDSSTAGRSACRAGFTGVRGGEARSGIP